MSANQPENQGDRPGNQADQPENQAEQPENQGGAAEPPARRKTLQSVLSFASSRRRGTMDSVKSAKKKIKEKGPFQEHYSCYEGLSWEALAGYLQEKWPGIKLVERKELDQWLFETPERLTEVDRSNIAALRDSNKAPRPRSRSPE